MAPVAQLEAILESIRHDGGRVTLTRRAVLAVLFEGPSHVTVEEVHEAVLARHAGVAQSTIYRLLEDLERRGIVLRCHVGPGPAVYHVAGASHHHLLCERCRAVTDVPAEELAALARRLEDRYGFALPDHLSISGLCLACRDTGDTDSQP